MSNTQHVVIAVMGVTGAGKSSFIKRVTGQNDILVEHSISSGTEEVKPYDFYYGSIKYTLVDTPGFDDSRSSDQIVIGKILAWLHSSYHENAQLNGLIFIHRISDPKMGGTALSNLRMFRQLCGPDCLKNVVLATTFWGNVDIATGARREKELFENDLFWGRMVAKGSQVVRITEDRSSNMQILLGIAKNNGKVVLMAQKEMLAGKSALETSAAQEVSREWNQWKLEKEQELAAERRKYQVELEEKEKAQRALWQQKKREAEREVERRIRDAEERVAREKHRQSDLALARRAAESAAQQKKEREEQLAQERRMEEAVRKEQAEQQRRLQEIRQQYYRDWVCCRTSMKRGFCDRCGSRIPTETSYYHCCFCYNDNYDQCLSCGSRCGDSDHPYMKFRTTLESDCTVM